MPGSGQAHYKNRLWVAGCVRMILQEYIPRVQWVIMALIFVIWVATQGAGVSAVLALVFFSTLALSL